MRKVVLVFSGGQDSTTCLFHALARYDEVHTLTFDYGQRHGLEIEMAKKIAGSLGVSHHVLDSRLINQLAPSALTRSDIAVSIEEDSAGRPNTFVPGRNIIFLSLAAIYAYQIGAQDIMTGVCETDFSGYPDCRDDFIKSLNVALNLGMDKKFRVHTPLMWLDKAEIWALADHYGRLAFIRDETLTCYNGIIGDGCGECPACLLRKRGLDAYLAAPEAVKKQALAKLF